MKTQQGFTTEETLIVLAIIALLLLNVFTPMISCSSKADAMSVKHSWGPLKGCMIEVEKDRWVPLENYRAL